MRRPAAWPDAITRGLWRSHERAELSGGPRTGRYCCLLIHRIAGAGTRSMMRIARHRLSELRRRRCGGSALAHEPLERGEEALAHRAVGVIAHETIPSRA